MLTLFIVLDHFSFCEVEDDDGYTNVRAPRHRAEPAKTPSYLDDFEEEAGGMELRRVTWLQRCRALLFR